MSLGQDISEIKELVKKDVFKAATPEQVSHRQEGFGARYGFKRGDIVVFKPRRSAVGLTYAAEPGVKAVVEVPDVDYLRIKWIRDGKDHGQHDGGYEYEDFEKAVTENKINEADDPIFKAATPAQVAARKPKPTRITKYQIPLYDYDALSSEAKEVAVSDYLNKGYDSFAWDTTKEDAQQIGLKLHGTDRNGTMTGDFEFTAEECAKEIIKNHGKQTETYKTAKEFISGVKALGKETDENTYEWNEKFDELRLEFLRSLCEDYRIMYEKEEEYQSSEEAIAELFRANDYEFTEDGKIFRAPHGSSTIESKMNEQGDIFKAATPEQVATRVSRNQYSKLEDVYGPGKTEIWYWKSTSTNIQHGQEADFLMGYDWCEKKGCLPDLNNLQKTHVLLGTVPFNSIGEIYEKMQGEYWSPNGEANNLIRSKGLHHTSMSVGDIAKIGAQVWFTDNIGWVDLVTGKRWPEFDDEIQTMADNMRDVE